MASWKIIEETLSSIDRDKKIYIVECKKCKQVSEFMLKSKDELKGLKCEHCLIDTDEKVEKKEKTPFSQAKVDDNLRYRLKTIWLRLKKEGKLSSEWEESYENFRDWSLANGYTYFKVLERKNKNILCRPSNCIWVVSKFLTSIDKVEDTLSFKVRVYNNILTRTMMLVDNIDELDKEVEIFNGLSGIDKLEAEKLKKKVARIKNDINMVIKLEETAWPDKDKVEGRG